MRRPARPRLTRRPFALALACVATVVSVVVAPLSSTVPASAGTVTHTNACTWLTGEQVPIDVTVTGSATPANPAYLSTFTLAPVRVSGSMPWWAATVAHAIGLIHEGPNTITMGVRLSIGATNASPASQDVVAQTTAYVDFDPDLPFTPAGQASQLITVSNLLMPSSTWTRTGQAPPQFRQKGFKIRATIGPLDRQEVLKDCYPATWSTGDVPKPTAATPPPFAVVGQTLPDPTFSDVLYGHPFFREVEWAAAESIATGYADGTFRPSSWVTRQAFASFLYKAAGSPSVTAPAGAPAFRDVPKTHQFFDAIEWARQQGIIAGYSDGSFRPTASVTRQAAAQWIMRASASSAPIPAKAPFRDVPVSHPFAAAIAWLGSEGIASGFSDGTFRPGATVARQAAAAWLQRAAI